MTPADAALDLLEVVGAAYPKDADTLGVTLVPGQITTDDWCWAGCGTAYIRLDTMYASTRFPQADAEPRCDALMAARFHVGVHRCVAGMTEAGEPPTVEQQTEDALALMDDAHRLRCAIHTLPTPRYARGRVLLGGWTPVGPLGDCAGGFWPVTLRL